MNVFYNSHAKHLLRPVRILNCIVLYFSKKDNSGILTNYVIINMSGK